MKNKLILSFFLLPLLQATAFAAVLDKTDKAREQLLGIVNSVHVEISKVAQKDGAWVEEDPPMPWLLTRYDRIGHRIEEVQIYTNQSLDFTSVFTRDLSGKLTEGVEYDANKNMAFKWIYTHDEASEVIEERRFDPSGTFFSRTTYRYDMGGNLVEENRFPPHSKNHFRWIHKYDAAGRHIEESHFMIRSGITPEHLVQSLNSRRIFVYDKKGVLTEEARYDGLGKIISKKHYSYEYDKRGNWITQKASEALQNPAGLARIPTEVTYRKITYHE
jgi:hypothetical protein